MAVSEVNFTLLADEGIDDLPRTLRRERDARERAAREEEERKRRATRTHDFEPLAPSLAPASYAAPKHAGADAVPAIVTRFDVPFLGLVTFFIKAVVAAVPALFLLGVMLWLAGDALKTLFPWLVKMQILIRFPG
jgi:hypothetical protein